jgi:hypothetical protein
MLGLNEFTLWSDGTPGATVLRIRVKDSAGTVVDATVVLS